jgi:hypothetical protein
VSIPTTCATIKATTQRTDLYQCLDDEAPV